MSEPKRDPNERGALWEKSSAKGTYMTGTIDGQPCVVFRNDRKQPGSKAPDWRVLKPTAKAERPVNDSDDRSPIDDSDLEF